MYIGFRIISRLTLNVQSISYTTSRLKRKKKSFLSGFKAFYSNVLDVTGGISVRYLFTKIYQRDEMVGQEDCVAPALQISIRKALGGGNLSSNTTDLF